MGTKEWMKENYRHLAETMIPKFKKRNMDAYYCDDAAEAVKLVKELIPEGSVTANGGSQTLADTGILDLIKSERYHYIDRSEGKSPQETRRIYGEICCADYFLMSTNAFTKDGELINIDGRGNRVSFLCFGPEHVIIVTGMNKLTSNVSEAIDRVHNIASPPNCVRLGLNTPCSHTGICGDCHGKDTICCQEVITRHSKQDGRIKIIMIGEDLGF